jgi:hypothetical protein
MPSTWASPISSSCRSPSIPSIRPGATSRPGSTRRPRASAIPPASPASSTARTRPARRHPRLGAGAFPDRRARAGPLRRHGALRARRPAPGLPPGLEHRDLQFRPQARWSSFLVNNALYWLEKFHLDGLRVDAVASMLYLDYSRKAASGCPTSWRQREPRGGRVPAAHEPAEATAASRHHDHRRGIDLVAGVSRRCTRAASASASSGTWASCTTRCAIMAREPIHRKHPPQRHDLRPALRLQENFVLPLSHDEVVHGKGSLLAKMAGDDWQKFANAARLLRLHVGLSRQEAAVHGPGIRPARGMERGARARLVAARCAHARGHAPAGARPQPLYREGRRCMRATASRKASSG